MKYKVTKKFDASTLKKKLKDGTFKSLYAAAGFIRTVARRSIKSGKKSSPAGTPPNTRRGNIIRNAILFAVDKDKSFAVIGPSADIAGDVGKAHEFGGRFRGRSYPKRAFMGPALDKALPMLPAQWSGSVHN